MHECCDVTFTARDSAPEIYYIKIESHGTFTVVAKLRQPLCDSSKAIRLGQVPFTISSKELLQVFLVSRKWNMRYDIKTLKEAFTIDTWQAFLQIATVGSSLLATPLSYFDDIDDSLILKTTISERKKSLETIRQTITIAQKIFEEIGQSTEIRSKPLQELLGHILNYFDDIVDSPDCPEDVIITLESLNKILHELGRRDNTNEVTIAKISCLLLELARKLKLWSNLNINSNQFLTVYDDVEKIKIQLESYPYNWTSKKTWALAVLAHCLESSSILRLCVCFLACSSDFRIPPIYGALLRRFMELKGIYCSQQDSQHQVSVARIRTTSSGAVQADSGFEWSEKKNKYISSIAKNFTQIQHPPVPHVLERVKQHLKLEQKSGSNISWTTSGYMTQYANNPIVNQNYKLQLQQHELQKGQQEKHKNYQQAQRRREPQKKQVQRQQSQEKPQQSQEKPQHEQEKSFQQQQEQSPQQRQHQIPQQRQHQTSQQRQHQIPQQRQLQQQPPQQQPPQQQPPQQEETQKQRSIINKALNNAKTLCITEKTLKNNKETILKTIRGSTIQTNDVGTQTTKENLSVNRTSVIEIKTSDVVDISTFIDQEKLVVPIKKLQDMSTTTTTTPSSLESIDTDTSFKTNETKSYTPVISNITLNPIKLDMISVKTKLENTDELSSYLNLNRLTNRNETISKKKYDLDLKLCPKGEELKKEDNILNEKERLTSKKKIIKTEKPKSFLTKKINKRISESELITRKEDFRKSKSQVQERQRELFLTRFLEQSNRLQQKSINENYVVMIPEKKEENIRWYDKLDDLIEQRAVM